MQDKIYEPLPARVIIYHDEDEDIVTNKKSDPKMLENRIAVKADLLLLEVPSFDSREFKKTDYQKELMVRCKKRFKVDMKTVMPSWTRKSDFYTKKFSALNQLRELL